MTQQGIDGEQKGYKLIRELLPSMELQQLDLLGKMDDKYIAFEIKQRELYSPPPFAGTGLDIAQLKRRLQLQEDLDIRTYMIVFVTGTDDVYGQYLDKLEEGLHFDTKNGIRIFDIANFIKLK